MIGYNATHAIVLEEELGDLPTMGSALRPEITDVLKNYAQKSINAGQIISGLVKTKQMQALAHWVRVFKKEGKEVAIDGL